MLLGIVEEKDFIVRMSESIAKRHLKGPERKGRRAREEEKGGVRGSWEPGQPVAKVSEFYRN